jgi:tetratricopeptide (TPR) repeat protein
MGETALYLLEERRMSEHPRRETLEGFLQGNLPAGEIKSTVTHLLAGCDSCRAEMTPLATTMFTPEGAPVPQLSAQEETSYDLAISAAFARALEHERTLRLEREAAERKAEEILHAILRSEAPTLEEGVLSWGFCETLIEKSLSLRFTDRKGMLHLANLARLAADRLDPEAYGEERRADMQARTWGELANAYRVNDDFAQAEAAMACALDLRFRGTSDPLLYARIADLNAALLCDQRRFREAFQMLDLAYAIRRRYSGTHEVGWVVILKGLYTGYAGRPEEGLQLLVRGLSMIDRARDSKLVFQTLHNILLFRVELGDYEQARRQLKRMRPLYARAVGPELNKLHWIEGQIAAGLGDLVTAEATFQQIRQDFEESGLGYEAALVTLDLAGVWLRQGRTSEVRRTVSELIASFRALGVEREALSALHMLQEALERDQATLEILRLVSGILRRLQHEPATRAGLDGL